MTAFTIKDVSCCSGSGRPARLEAEVVAPSAPLGNGRQMTGQWNGPNRRGSAGEAEASEDVRIAAGRLAVLR